MPVLALALLVMNSGFRGWVGPELRNGWVVTTFLVLTVALFVYLAIAGIGEG